jgi:hypothetical protein
MITLDMSNVIKTGNQIGKGLAVINLAIAVCIAMSLSASGGFLVVRKPEYPESVDGVITKSVCTPEPQSDGKIIHMCNVEYEYTVDGKKYVVEGKTEKYKKYIDGDKIKVFYDPTNIENSQVDGINTRLVGLGFFGVGICIVLIAAMWFYFTKHVKGAGTALTVMTALRVR